MEQFENPWIKITGTIIELLSRSKVNRVKRERLFLIISCFCRFAIDKREYRHGFSIDSRQIKRDEFDGFSSWRENHMFSVHAHTHIDTYRHRHARTARFCSRHGRPIDPRDRATLCSIETERSAQVWARWSSPFPTWRGRTAVGGRNVKPARFNSCFALSAIWEGENLRFADM